MHTVTQQLVYTPEFVDALAHLNRGENLFLTGKAGTGKSTLIRTFLAQNGRNAIVVAPTGIAALNVDGYTIHRLFSFHKDTTVEYVKSDDYYPRRFAQALKEIDTLIIDEASMVRADMFDCIAIALQRFGPHPNLPFGGVQVVLVGDLFQLPPVVLDSEQEFFATTYDSQYFFSATHFESQEFPAVQLTTVFRQVGDTQFVDLLNQVREGVMLEGARSELNDRVDADFQPPLDEFWLTLTTTNKSADKRNRETLAKLPGPQETFHSIMRGDFDGFEKPVEEQVNYKTGAQVMMVTNDPTNRWVNGTIGRVVAHKFQDGSPLVSVELTDGKIVEVGPHIWDVTRPVSSGGRLIHEVIGTYTQLPFRLAWAITIHKSQGQTLDRVVVDLTGGAFAYGQLYVALSRCTALSGLVLTKAVRARDLQVDQRIRRFLSAEANPGAARSNVYLGVCAVGQEGRMWRPRPVEIALVTDDGVELSTFINPDQDLGNARIDYDISAAQIQFAPTLVQAWAALSPYLAGRTPVGVNIDRLLSHIDYELKRHGYVVSMPVGTDLDPWRLGSSNGTGPGNNWNTNSSRTALGRARAARDLFWSGSVREESGDIFYDAEPLPGYLLPRELEPVSFVVGGVAESGTSLEQELVRTLRALAESTGLSAEAQGVIRGVETVTGQEILPIQTDQSKPQQSPLNIAQVLVPGAVVCFTGTVFDASGWEIDREVLEDLAVQQGLRVEPTVTKSRLTALIVAEAGTQSNKAKSANRFGKPIFTVAEFLALTEGNQNSLRPNDSGPLEVQILSLYQSTQELTRQI